MTGKVDKVQRKTKLGTQFGLKTTKAQLMLHGNITV